VTVDIPATMLLDREVLDDPYPFYRRLHREAPVWQVPGTEVFVVTTFEMVAEATARVTDFSSNMRCLLYRDDAGLPARLAFGGEDGVETLATALTLRAPWWFPARRLNAAGRSPGPGFPGVPIPGV